MYHPIARAILQFARLLPGYGAQSGMMYQPVFMEWIPEPDLFTPQKQAELDYEPPDGSITQEEWDRYHQARARVANRTVEYRGNAFSGVLNLTGNARANRYNPAVGEVQAKFDTHMTNDEVAKRALTGVNKDTEDCALEITKELYPLLYIRPTYQAIHLCLEWAGTYRNDVYNKYDAIAQYNAETAGDTDLNRNYRDPTTNEEHGGLLFHAALTLKHEISCKGLAACGIVSIEETKQFKEGHVKLLLVVDTSSLVEDVEDFIARTIARHGFRFKSRDAHGMAGQSIQYIGRDFNGIFKAVLYLLKFQPSHSKAFTPSAIPIRKSWFQFRATKRLPSTALGPIFIQAYQKRSRFWLPCEAPAFVYEKNHRWVSPLYVDAQHNAIFPAAAPDVINDLPSLV